LSTVYIYRATNLNIYYSIEKEDVYMKPAKISYCTVYTNLWEYLTLEGAVPAIFPPPLTVDWKGAPKRIHTSDKRYAGYETARYDTQWVTFGTPEESPFINPAEYGILVRHKSRLHYLNHPKAFNGKQSAYAHWFHLCHDLIHEIGHYLTAYKAWARSHSDEYPEPHPESLKILVKHIRDSGTLEDERQNEAWTLQVLGKTLDINPDLTPTPTGRYAQYIAAKYNWPTYPEACALYGYYKACYELMDETLSPKRRTAIEEFGDTMVNYSMSCYDPEEQVEWIE